MLVATVIANPAAPVLTVDAAERAANAVHSRTLYWLDDGVAADIVPDGALSPEAVMQALRTALAGIAVDVVVQVNESRRKRLLMADMDSTMIGQECIDELADVLGLRAHVSAITARAMNGEIPFEAALKERVALLKGLKASVVDEVIDRRISLTPGGLALVATMKRAGAYSALVSGGFTAFTRPVAAMLGFDENQANVLIEADGYFTGTVAEPILGRQAKADALLALTSRLGLTPNDCLAVGDGANDLSMLQLAGSGVALHAKPAIAREARHRIDRGDLTALLYMQGYRRSEFAA